MLSKPACDKRWMHELKSTRLGFLGLGYTPDFPTAEFESILRSNELTKNVGLGERRM